MRAGFGPLDVRAEGNRTKELSAPRPLAHPVETPLLLNKEALVSHIQFCALETLFSALRPLSFLLISDVYSNNPEDRVFPVPPFTK